MQLHDRLSARPCKVKSTNPPALARVRCSVLSNDPAFELLRSFMQIVDPARGTRRWLKVSLTVAGALGGAAFGIILTRFGKIAAAAPPATLANYAWNATVFAVIAGVVSPIVSWSSLRRVPLWRTVVEPLAYALAAGGAGVMLGVPVLSVLLPPAGLALGLFSLARRYKEPQSLPSLQPADDALTPAKHR